MPRGDLGLGRLPAFDQRDRLHQIRPLLASTEPRKEYAYWHGSAFLDQGSTSMCVEYAWHHYVQAGRVRPRAKYPYWTVGEPYHAMQKIDEWPGEDYDGTSVRAGAKLMQEMGFITEYRWAWDLETVVDAVTRLGPVVVGTNWYDDMFDPDQRGIVRATGYNLGGHAWLIDGANRKHGMARAKNSWGRSWGKNGRFWIPFEDLEKLINEDGEACLSVEAVV